MNNCLKPKLIPAGPNGYTPTQDEFSLLKEQRMQNMSSCSFNYSDPRFHNPINLPELYLTQERYDEIYEEMVGKVLEKKH